MNIKISEKIKTTPITNPEKLANILQKVLKAESKGDRLKEHFWGIYFNARVNIIRIELISLGTLNFNLAHPRETFVPALESRSASIIVCHNHPSDDIEPSEDDLLVTNRLIEAGEILGIKLEDHIIISPKSYYSFKENKLI